MRRLGATIAVLAALLVGAPIATAGPAAGAGEAAPAGPRLAYVGALDDFRSETELATVGSEGDDPLRLAGGLGYREVHPEDQTRPSWSPDGSRIAFWGGPKGFYVVGASGGIPHLVPNLSKLLIVGEPVFAPDGRHLVFPRVQHVSGQFERPRDDNPLVIRFGIWSIAVGGTELRPLTPWRRSRVLLPTSFSPDGRLLAATQFERGHNRPSAVAIDLESGRTKLIARDATEAAFAPDGRVAVVRDHHGRRPDGELDEDRLLRSDLLIAPRLGAQPRKVAGIRGGFFSPSWDPSGERLAFTRLPGVSLGSLFQPTPTIAEINADGSCRRTLLHRDEGSFAGVAWQPGPGRGAGPIAC